MLPWIHPCTYHRPPLHGHAAAGSSVRGGEAPWLRLGERHGWEVPALFPASFLLTLVGENAQSYSALPGVKREEIGCTEGLPYCITLGEGMLRKVVPPSSRSLISNYAQSGGSVRAQFLNFMTLRGG